MYFWLYYVKREKKKFLPPKIFPFENFGFLIRIFFFWTDLGHIGLKSSGVKKEKINLFESQLTYGKNSIYGIYSITRERGS